MKRDDIKGLTRLRVLALTAVIVSAAVTATGAWATAAVTASGYERIDGARLEAMLSDGAPIVVVDVREPWLYKKGHVPGAINIPYDGARDRVLKELKPTDRIVFVCHGGPMGDELGELLAGKGYPEVYNLIGGMRRWKGPVEK